MKRRTLVTLSATALAGLAVAAACGPAGFTSSTVVDSVRILATRIDHDKSYALPGDVVTLETLTVDGRTNKSPPAVTYWIPYVCENPVDDAYYGCFAPLLGEDAGAAQPGSASVDAGADDAGTTPVITPAQLGQIFAAGTDLTPYLPTGPFTFRVPLDAITSHVAPGPGNPAYGIVIIFNIACAGRVKTLPINVAAGPQQVPLGCFDSSGNALGPDQYVIGFTRIYVSTTKTNANPVIGGFVFNGNEVAADDAGGGNPSPVAVKMPKCAGGCAGVPIDMDVPQSSWTNGATEDGGAASKSIWVDYYSVNGLLGDEARLLYDQNAGPVNDSVNPVTFSDDGGTSATLYAVVHDSNDGVTWLQVNVSPP